MPNYDFNTLSPIDFEELVRDLLQKHYEVFIESFAEGKDGGIDLRYFKAGKTTIVQCKRYNNINNLINNLKKEHEKITKLKPKQYIIATSCNLTDNQKKRILDVFNDINLRTEDILGRKDLNNLLNQYEEIEKKHIKLWLTSAAVLEKLLRKSTYNRSDFEKENILDSMKVFVLSDAVNKAHELLDNHNCVIISGIPGIGKTTLARYLSLVYMKKGWEFISITNNIQEVYEIFDENKKQFYFYDDFLGTNFLKNYLVKNEDKEIINFLNRVKKFKRTKIVLTTREYIISQASETYESFQGKSLDMHKYILDLQIYSKLIKCRMLYNHLYYSALETTYLEDIIKGKRYLNIINHSNFNPRLIYYLTNKEYFEIEGNNYYNYFIQNLNDPVKIWENTYTTKISDISRYLLIVLATFDSRVKKDELYESLKKYICIRKELSQSLDKNLYKKALKECENCFIDIYYQSENFYINFQNPSIKDYIVNFIKKDGDIIRNLIQSAIYLKQLFGIFTAIDNDGKILLDNSYHSLYFDKIKAFDLIDNDNIYINNNRAYLKIITIYKFVTFFKKIKDANIINFIEKEIYNISLDTLSQYYLELFTGIIDKLPSIKTKHLPIIIDKVYQEEVTDFEDIKKLCFLKKKYKNYCKVYSVTAKLNKLDNIFESELKYMENDKHQYFIDEFINNLEDFETTFQIDLGDYRNKAEKLLDEVKLETEDEEDDSNDNNYNTLIKDENALIIDMFNSLIAK